jgi:hypothetical protein
VPECWGSAANALEYAGGTYGFAYIYVYIYGYICIYICIYIYIFIYMYICLSRIDHEGVCDG